MKRLCLALLLAVCASAQAVSNLPQYALGAGPSWTRGGSSPYAADLMVGIRVAQTQFYSWTDVATPFRIPPAPGAAPVTSTITTGIAYVATQTKSGAATLLFLGQAGVTAVQATSTSASLAFSGSVAAAFRLGKKPVYLMPYAKAASVGTGNGVMFQPGLQVVYGFFQ